MSNCSSSLLTGLILIVSLSGCVSNPEKSAPLPDPPSTTAAPPVKPAASLPSPGYSPRTERVPAEVRREYEPSTRATVRQPASAPPAASATDTRSPVKRVERPPQLSSQSVARPAPDNVEPTPRPPEKNVQTQRVEPVVTRSKGPAPKPVKVAPKPPVTVAKPEATESVAKDVKSIASRARTTAKQPAVAESRDVTEKKIEAAVAASGELTDAAETRLAMLTKPAPVAPSGPDISKLSFELEHLPVSFPGGWQLDKRPDQVDGEVRCLLYSPKLAMFDGYDKSRVQLQVTTRAVVVKADSNLDVSYPYQGLRIDSGSLAAFEPQLLNENAALTRKPVQAAMASGRQLTVALGFWPTWPMTKTQELKVDLNGFAKAYQALQACTEE